MPADLEKLAYESALRALDKQERLVEELRARTGMVLAASSVVATFLGRQSLGGPGPVGIALLAIVCFVVAVGGALFALLPNRSLVFSIRGISVADDIAAFREAHDDLLRTIIDALDDFWETNDAAIRRMSHAFSVATFALGVEVVAMAALLGGTIL
jgi:hypothetical protein